MVDHTTTTTPRNTTTTTTSSSGSNAGIAFVVGALVVIVGALAWIMLGAPGIDSSSGGDLNVRIEGAADLADEAAAAVEGAAEDAANAVAGAARSVEGAVQN